MHRAEWEGKKILTKLLFDYFLSKVQVYLDMAVCIQCKLLTVNLK